MWSIRAISNTTTAAGAHESETDAGDRSIHPIIIRQVRTDDVLSRAIQMKMISSNRCVSSVCSDVTFVSSELDGMPSGTVELSVPLIGGVIQIGVGGDLEVGRIRVRKDSSTVTVTRVDGRPMQVEVVVDTHQTTKSPVFREPVRVLRLRRLADPAGAGWYTTTSMNVARPEHLKQFADIIGVFGSAKQRNVAPV
jgi:hypothetical protein